jgi:hypothetical protein
MGPTVSCQQVDTCCRWCLVLEGVALIAVAVMKTVAVKDAVAKALVLKVRALAGEELLWSVATQLALLSLARSDAA